MEAVIFVGIQGSGKTTFYRERLFDTHVRISLDMLRTRWREQLLIQACLAAQQPFVIDNTNVLAAGRANYIALAKAAGFRVIGYYFQPQLREAIRRNAERPGAKAIPVKGVIGTYKRLQPPAAAEGFDELYSVRIGTDNEFLVEPWTPPPESGAGEPPAAPGAGS
jgi:predicted kinase